MKINWAQKLSSRKFWCAVGAFITSIMLACGIVDVTNATAIISSMGVLVAYILGESYVDAKREEVRYLDCDCDE